MRDEMPCVQANLGLRLFQLSQESMKTAITAFKHRLSKGPQFFERGGRREMVYLAGSF